MQTLNVAKRWRTEQAAVLAAELRGALVADLERGSGRIQALREHQLPCFIQPQSLLELQRAHGCQRPEVMMEARDAHPAVRRQVIDTDRLREVILGHRGLA